MIRRRWVDGYYVLTCPTASPGEAEPFSVTSCLLIESARMVVVRVTFHLGKLLWARDPRRTARIVGTAELVVRNGQVLSGSLKRITRMRIRSNKTRRDA